MASTDMTAVLIFARTSEEEVRHKPIGGGTALFDALTWQTLNTVKRTGLPYFHYTEAMQEGDTFGDRLAAAIEKVLQRGFDHLIVIGNDTPQLRARHLTLAHQSLLSGNSVLGPSRDGGFYLLGLSRHHFDRNAFRSLPWRTRRIYQAAKRFLMRNGLSPIGLRAFMDIDSQSDVITFLTGPFKASRRLMHLLQCLVRSASDPSPGFMARGSSLLWATDNFNKGSPNS